MKNTFDNRENRVDIHSNKEIMEDERITLMESMIERTLSALESTASKDEVRTLQKNLETKLRSVKDNIKEVSETAANAEEACTRLAEESLKVRETLLKGSCSPDIEEKLLRVSEKNKSKMDKVHEWMRESQELMRDWTQKMDWQLSTINRLERMHEERDTNQQEQYRRLDNMVNDKVGEAIDKMGELLKK